MYRYLVIIVVSFMPSYVIAAEHPTAFELLDKYATTQDKLRSSFISKLEVSTKWVATIRARPYIRPGRVYEHNPRMEIRSDGKRCYVMSELWGKMAVSAPISKENASHNYHLWDGKMNYQYNYSPRAPKSVKNGTATLSNKAPVRVNYYWQQGKGHALRGYFRGVDERIDSELRQAQNISVESQKEDINGSLCYLITAKTKRCEYWLWIDPDHGYNIAKAIVKRDWAGLRKPEHLPEDQRPPKGDAEDRLTKVRFREIDGVWLPVEADYRSEHKDVTGDYEKQRTHIKINEFIMNPDHDALGSFEPAFINNGARVRLQGVSDITYTWQDGLVVDKSGRVIMDCRSKKPTKVNNEFSITIRGSSMDQDKA